MFDSLIETWRRIIIGEYKSWALFSNGTCVILAQPEVDLRRQAVEMMKAYGPGHAGVGHGRGDRGGVDQVAGLGRGDGRRHGPVHAGAPAGDFSVITLDDDPGWVVTSHHPDILTYVSPDEVAEQRNDLVIGLLGRSKRDLDAAELMVIHVEDSRGVITQ